MNENFPWDPNPISDLEIGLIQAMIIGEPIFYILSSLLVVISSVILVYKTKASGKWLIFSCPMILLSFFVIQKLINPSFPFMLEQGLMQVTLTKFVVSLSFFLGALGLIRLAWWASKVNKVEKS